MKHFARLFLIGLSCIMCSNSANQTESNHEITCTESGCKGTYEGPEFVNGSDVAHQFSNHMSREVGIKLKQLYDDGKYAKVDLPNISMTTKGMDHEGEVVYSLDIPFMKVKDACNARTAFDHRGGWGHKIKKSDVLNIFKSTDKLDIVELNTPEGLQEFWVQWRHNTRQSNCR